jgi:hypothetical protein
VDDGRWVVAEAGEAHAPSELARTEPDAAAGLYHMASIRGRRGDVDFGPSHRDFGNRIGRGIGNVQPLNVEQGVGGNGKSNV